ncbi:hypothetical protein Cva_00763 [Caedimonas varicaedens]|uniref:Uncharacterized protein n=1 Tax=Caedimonas varicaedens TaxID=1629334 RepID=A0A0K8MC44_9PROT|nr:hypothetical protein Cva_00763 [Caedimonas varicaedens]
MGLVKLFAGMAKPGYGDGLNGALSALTQNMPSAVDAYTGEEGRVQNINAALLNHVSQMRAKQQEAWMNAVDKAREREYKDKTLTETERHNKKMEENTKSSHDETSRYHNLWLSDRQEQAENKMMEKKIQRLENRLKDKKYDAAESELNALMDAEELLKKGDPLRGKMWSFIEDKLWKKPELLKGADESKFEVSQSDMKGHAFKRFGYRHVAEFKGLKEVDPLKGRKANLGIVETRKKQLLPIIKQKMALEAQKEALETGEDWRPILTQNWDTFLRSLESPPEKSDAPKGKGHPTPPTQKSVSMKDKDGHPLVVPSEDVDEVLALGGSYAR